MKVVQQKMHTWSDKVECRFFVREAEESPRVDLEQLKKSSGGRVVYRNFIHNDFDTEVATDYVIINANPQRVAEMPPRLVLLRVPINNEEYWVTVEDNAAETLADRFNKLWENGRTLESAAELPRRPIAKALTPGVRKVIEARSEGR